MRARSLRPLLLALVLVLVAQAGATQALPAPSAGAPADAHVERAPVTPVVARALGSAGELRGMTLNDSLAGRAGLMATLADFPRMAAEGITSVTVYVYLYVDDPAGTTVFAGNYTPTDIELEQVADAAHTEGMDLHLMPVLLDRATSSWRGAYVPSDLKAFFASYTAQLVHYAKLAEREGVTLFYVGSENQAIAKHTELWKAAIRAVRLHYRGALSYLSTSYTTHTVKFWSSLDLAAISPYFAMGEDDNPTYERFMSAWREVHTPFVRKLAASLPRPLIYGEVGYNSQQNAFGNPALKPPATKMAAPAAQGDGYRAVLDVLRQNPHVYGATWFRWGVGTTALDTSYSPNGKPAECVIAANWSQDARVREAATSSAQCDLHALDQALAVVGALLPETTRRSTHQRVPS